MAKDNIALLQEVVGQLRKLNQLSTRDRLRESEEAKRAEAIAVQGEVQEDQGAMVVNATEDFRRRFIAGQAKSFVDDSRSDKPKGKVQKSLLGNSIVSRDYLYDIATVLDKQYAMWQNLLGVQSDQLKLSKENQLSDKKFRLDTIRNANEKRIEGINPKGIGSRGSAGAGSALALAKLNAEDAEEDNDDSGAGLGTGLLLGAGGTGIGATLLLKMKKIKKWLGIGSRFGFAATMKARFGLLGKNLFAGRPMSAAQKKLAKNPRMWPVLLAALVATSFLSDSDEVMTEFDSEGAVPGGGTGNAETGMDKTLGAVNTGLNVWLGYSIANWVSKKMLKKTLFQAAKAMLIRVGATAAGKTLASFALRGLMVAGAAAAGLSAPVWGGILLAAYTGYKLFQMTSAMSQIHEDEQEGYSAPAGDHHAPMSTKGLGGAELIAATLGQTGELAASPLIDELENAQINAKRRTDAVILLRGTEQGPLRKAVYDGLLKKGWKAGELDKLMKDAGIPPIRGVFNKNFQSMPDMFTKENIALAAKLISPTFRLKDGIKKTPLQLRNAQIDNPTADGPMSFRDSPIHWFKASEPAAAPIIIPTDQSVNDSSITNINIYQDQVLIGGTAGSGNNSNSVTTSDGIIYSW